MLKTNENNIYSIKYSTHQLQATTDFELIDV